MNQKHLLRFIKKQMKTQRDMVVTNKNGEQRTLKQVMHMHSVFLLNQTCSHSQTQVWVRACMVSLKCFAKMCMYVMYVYMYVCVYLFVFSYSSD